MCLLGQHCSGSRWETLLMTQTSDKLFEAAELKEYERILSELRGQEAHCS